MKAEQYESWAKKRDEQIMTHENFSSENQFRSSIEDFSKSVKVEELNPEISRVGLVGDIFQGKEKGYYYARTNHHNFVQLEQELKEIEVGRLSHPEYFSCKVFPSGMAAIKSTLEALSLGEEGVFIHGNVMYPSTKTLLADQGNGKNMIGGLPGIGADLNNSMELAREIFKINNNGKKVLGVIMEPVANPTIRYTDVTDVAKVAHKFNVPVIVDNTFLTSYLLEPFRMGADVVIHSLTKYFSGQGDMTGGAVIMPNELEANVQNVRRHGGAIMSINDAYEFSKRLGGLAGRIKKHSKNARILSEELEGIDGISVNYNDLDGITRSGYAGGVLSFEFEGDDVIAFQRARKFSQYIIDHPGIAKHAVSLAESETLAFSYAGLVDKDLIDKLGLSPGLVRIACGREPHYKPIANDIREGVEASL